MVNLWKIPLNPPFPKGDVTNNNYLWISSKSLRATMNPTLKAEGSKFKTQGNEVTSDLPATCAPSAQYGMILTLPGSKIFAASIFELRGPKSVTEKFSQPPNKSSDSRSNR